MLNKEQKEKETKPKRAKRPLIKSDLEAVLKAATKALKQQQDEKESAET